MTRKPLTLNESGGDKEYASLPEQHRFVIPDGCHWQDVRERTENLGSAIVGAMRKIELANPDTLYGVLSMFSAQKWTDKKNLSDGKIRDLIEHLSTRKLGNKNYPTDLMGDAYEILLKKFVGETKDTSGGDGDEFYELVIKKIVEETPWREDASRAILLISDAAPHPLGYTYEDRVVGNQIDWRKEAEKAASKRIKIDTVTITDEPWYKELSQMTDGVSVPFESGYKTARLVEAATMARGSAKQRAMFDKLASECSDEELKAVYCSCRIERDDI